MVILRLAVALVGLALFYAAIFASPRDATPGGIAAAVGFTAIYAFIGYRVRPKPDMDNVGWAGGLVNHPFRYSDDLNRTLLVAVVLLFPGRFLAEAVLDGLQLLRRVRR